MAMGPKHRRGVVGRGRSTKEIIADGVGEMADVVGGGGDVAAEGVEVVEVAAVAVDFAERFAT